VRDRISRAIDEFEAADDTQWSNIKALQGPEWKGRLRKRVGPYRIIFRKFPDRGVVGISAILLKSKGTYR
jgi:mRNA-degrading endonuclease RelE of RelBE toxin-antitoxin system